MFKHLSNLQLAAITDSLFINIEDGRVSTKLEPQVNRLMQELKKEIKNRQEGLPHIFIEKHSPFAEANGFEPH